MKTYGALCLISAVSTAWATCDQLRAIPNPLTEDMTITMSSDVVECPIDDNNEMEQFVIDGGTLTFTGESKTTFSNMRFQVKDGAAVVFDFERTTFGPNTGYENEDDFGVVYMLEVLEGGSAEFTGNMRGEELRNMRSVFYNAGEIEFKGTARFLDIGTSVFRVNLGRLRFRGNTVFKNIPYIALDNNGGDVRFSGTSRFEHIGHSFNGNSGAGFANFNGGKAVFRGDAIFKDNDCDENGGGVSNNGELTFYGKAYFWDNRAVDGHGGGLDHGGGNLTFKGAVQFLRNRSGDSGGGFAMHAGATLTFRRAVTIKDNEGRYNGGAMSFFDSTDEAPASCVFRKEPTVSGNYLFEGEDDACTVVYIESEADITGYDAVCN